MQTPSPADADALAELRRDAEAVNALSLYLHAKTHYEAIITVTEGGGLVLGLGLDDPTTILRPSVRRPSCWPR